MRAIRALEIAVATTQARPNEHAPMLHDVPSRDTPPADLDELRMTTTYDGIETNLFAVDRCGAPELRLALGMELYFPRPASEYREEILDLWFRFIDWAGKDVMTWMRLGGSHHSQAMNEDAYGSIVTWIDRGFPGEGPCSLMVDSGPWEQMGEASFRLEAFDCPQRPEQGDTALGVVRLHLPLSRADHPRELAMMLIQIATSLRFVCGTAGLMLRGNPLGIGEHTWETIEALVTRFEGVEPEQLVRGQHCAHFGLTGINWLTFIGREHLSMLGGLDVVEAEAAACPDVTARRIGQGIVLQAGPRPRLCDRNEPSPAIEPYCHVHRIVRPAMFLDEGCGFQGFHGQYFDAPATVEWLQRFGRPTHDQEHRGRHGARVDIKGHGMPELH